MPGWMAAIGWLSKLKERPMSKRKSAKYKLDRRMGENIWGRPNSPVNKRSYGPG